LINCRNLRKSSVNFRSFFGSKPVLVAIGAVMVFQLIFTYVPMMQHFFNTADIGFVHWGYIILSGIITFSLIEIEKMLI
jgi:magnesium-transporting ATPase (P-type)